MAKIALVCADYPETFDAEGVENTFFSLHNKIRLLKNFSFFSDQDLLDFTNINYQHRGLLAIAEVLIDKGHEVDYYANYVDFDRTRDYDIVGISSYTQNIENARRLSLMAKHEYPETLTVLGGAHANGIGSDDLKRELSFFDYIAKGHGGDAILAIINKLQDKTIKFEQNQNIYNQDNILSVRPLTEIETQPSYLNRAYNLLHYPLPSARIFFSEGCVHHCAFCANRRHRTISYDIDLVEREIELLTHNFHTKYLYVGDENFYLGTSRSDQIIDLMEKYSSSCKWGFQTRIGVPPQQAFEKLNPDSCVEIDLGIETANEKTRNLVGKNYGSLDTVYKTVEAYLKRNFNLLAYFIVGLPGETRTTIDDNFKFMSDLIMKGVMIEPGIFVPYPGTPIFENAGDYGIQIDKTSWSRFTSERIPPYRYENGLTAEEIRWLYNNGLETYLVPAYLGKYGSLLEKSSKQRHITLGTQII